MVFFLQYAGVLVKAIQLRKLCFLFLAYSRFLESLTVISQLYIVIRKVEILFICGEKTFVQSVVTLLVWHRNCDNQRCIIFIQS